MISMTPLEFSAEGFTDDPGAREDFGEVEYLLRRADEESVAAIRANDPRVHASHIGMARLYSRKSHSLIARIDEAKA